MHLLFCASILSGFVAVDSMPYRFDLPSQIIELQSAELREISGLSSTGQPGILAAIADEGGVVYLLDVQRNGAVIDQFVFRDKGDFEGVEWVGNCFYAVKSDGKIFEIKSCENNPDFLTYIHETRLTKMDDIEGLGYDSKRKSLLVACKSDPNSDANRRIFLFDIAKKTLGETPVYTIDVKQINKRLNRNSDSDKHYFSPSAIAVHPISGDIYVLSSAIRAIAVIDRNKGTLKQVVKLEKSILPQPEGITFEASGVLWISSESKNELKPRLVRYKP